MMAKKPKLKELILKAQGGDKDALNQVVERFRPIVKKYARRFGSEDVYSEVVEWIIRATMRYKEKSGWGREELEKFLSANISKKT
ncbi:helix-turn-helix domain-containing protein [Thermoanaerobacterium sp. DL9XJH110]|uniref:helix-turn-helix domain-containing protein n=1 Tax=Thermoanaerobacterium sp. DL9XJH110 TaxID=3386643 RepID=UPI003BB50C57